MNRFLAIFFRLAGLIALVMAGLAAADLRDLGLPVANSKSIWAWALIGAGLTWVGWRGSVRMQAKVFLLGMGVFGAELFLQVVAWAGLLPGVNTKERLPWARVYWTAEGHGNSIRNRYGWHFPEFDLAATNRVALIGDSFVEAVEVGRGKNMAAVLRSAFTKSMAYRTVLGLGEHGCGPAQYLEILKYAQRHFGIKEAVVVLYLGNDITDCAPGSGMHDPHSYLSYRLDPAGRAVLDPEGEQLRAGYQRFLQSPHRPILLFLPRLMISHSMLVQAPLSVRNSLKLRQMLQRDAVHNAGPGADIARLGLKAAPFAANPPPEIKTGSAIMKSLLSQAAEFARTNGIAIRLVTIPFFPPDLYRTKEAGWTGRVGDYDFLAPERDLAAWAVQNRIPLLALGEQMKAQGLTTDAVRALYLSGGSGHFSEAGHQFAAAAIKEAFFR